MTFIKCDAIMCRWNHGRECGRGQVNMAASTFVTYGGGQMVEVSCMDYEKEEKK